MGFALEKWLVIANPVSGYGRVQRKWEAIKEELSRQEIPFEFEFTTPERRGDKVATDAIANGYRKIICVGGDGHLHDIVNGIMTQSTVASTDITIAMISQGTGNDWIKTNGVPKDYKQAIAVIKHGKTYLQNAGLATSQKNGKRVARYFHNFAGVGFDAYIVQNVEGVKAYGHIAYLLVMLRCVFTYRKPLLRITTDRAVIESITYLTLTGIGRYAGGGMKLTPGAQPDGDEFYVSIAKDFSKLDVVRYTHKLFDGSFIDLDKAEAHLTKHVKIEVLRSEGEVYMEADGDMQGTGPWDISLVPKALRVVIP